MLTIVGWSHRIPIRHHNHLNRFDDAPQPYHYVRHLHNADHCNRLRRSQDRARFPRLLDLALGFRRLHHHSCRILYPTWTDLPVEHPGVQEARHLSSANQHTFHGRGLEVLLRAVRCSWHAAHYFWMVASLAAFQFGLIRSARMVLLLHYPDDRPWCGAPGWLRGLGEVLCSGSVHSLEVPQG